MNHRLDCATPGHLLARARRTIVAWSTPSALLGVSLAAGCAGRAPSTTPLPTTTAPVPASAYDSAISRITASIQSAYLYRDRITGIRDALEQSRGTIRSGMPPSEFADHVTAVMQRASPDGHLYLRDDSVRYTAALEPPRAPKGLAAHDRAESRRQNHGIAGTALLAEGIRYLRISGFRWTGDESRAVYDAAIRFLADADAIIIDLRGNTGGGSEGPDYLLNAILPPKTTLYTYEGIDATAASRTGDTGMSGMLGRQLLYVLVDGHTGSAAEAFAYALQQARAARIIGDPTFGAANNNREIPIAPRFMLSLSYRRPISPISGTNWEGTGVTPDIAVPGVRALAAAEVDALDRLRVLQQLPKAQRDANGWARVAAAARVNPPVWTAVRLESLAGQFGATVVRYAEGSLWLTRTDRVRWHGSMRLTPLTDDGLFSVDAFAFDDLRVRISEQRLEYLYGRDDAREVVVRDPTKP